MIKKNEVLSNATFACGHNLLERGFCFLFSTKEFYSIHIKSGDLNCNPNLFFVLTSLQTNTAPNNERSSVSV